MARARRSSDKKAETPAGGPGQPPVGPAPSPGATDPPVGILLFFRAGAEAEGIKHATDTLGVRDVVRSEDAADRALPVDQVPPGGMGVLSGLGLAFAEADSAQLQALRSATDSPVETVVALGSPAVEAEVSPLAPAEAPPDSRFLDYLRGYRDAVNRIAGALGIDDPTRPAASQASQAAVYRDDAAGTWGLHATGVLRSRFTGRGVRVAALVDGLATAHPDWASRQVVARSFVPPTSSPGMSGTHYLGTALGPAQPASGPRYGCAPDALPYVAQVLGTAGAGTRTVLLAALDWAITNQCRVILLPLGWGGPQADTLVEALARRIAARGSLLVASAGNNARRAQGNFGFVVNPAACPSVLGIGAVGPDLTLPDWSPRSSTTSGGAIDLVAPGVGLRSSVPGPALYASWNGSATAAAYVAGIAALWAEALPQATAPELWQALLSHARPLPFSQVDAGAGLVQAP